MTDERAAEVVSIGDVTAADATGTGEGVHRRRQPVPGRLPLLEPPRNAEDRGYRILATAVVRQAVFDLSPMTRPEGVRISARRFLIHDLWEGVWGAWVGDCLPRTAVAETVDAEWAGRGHWGNSRPGPGANGGAKPRMEMPPRRQQGAWPSGARHHVCSCGCVRGVHGEDGCGGCEPCTEFIPRSRAAAGATS